MWPASSRFLCLLFCLDLLAWSYPGSTGPDSSPVATAQGTVPRAVASWVLQAKSSRPALLERQLKEAVRRAPNNFEANHNLGEFYLHAAKLNEAIPWLEKARLLNPTHYANGYDLALAYVQTGE